MRGIYVHIPFCRSACNYCDFNRISGADDALMQSYAEALMKDLTLSVQQAPEFQAPDTLFFGGGTPSHLPTPILTDLLAQFQQVLDLSQLQEWTVEANPESLTVEKIALLKDAGVNRLSIGLQSTDANLLRLLGRIHKAKDAFKAVELAVDGGFQNISLDLMYGLPGETLAQWEQDLETVLALPITHLSAYQLAIEENTPFGKWQQEGCLPEVDDELARLMLECTEKLTTAKGFKRYEISNYAKPGYACKHNQIYWRMDPYLGVGAGATGFLRPYRVEKTPDIHAYIQAMKENPAQAVQRERISERDQMIDDIFMGLRLAEGLSLQTFANRYEASIEEIFPKALKKAMQEKWLYIADDHLRLTHEGALFANDVLLLFL